MAATVPARRLRQTTCDVIDRIAAETGRSQGDVAEAMARLAAAMPQAFASELAAVEPLRGRPGTGRQFKKSNKAT